MLNFQKNFQKSSQIYQQKKSTLPYKIAWKLDLILHLIQGNSIRKQQLDLEQQMQYQDLQNLDLNCLKIVFSNIINTLFHQSHKQYRKCSIKKKGLFNSWLNSTIAFDSARIILKYSNRAKYYDILDCQIRRSKDHLKCFELSCQKGVKYVIKFQNQQEMKSNLREFQRMMIESKTTKNYQEMTQFAEDTRPQFMAKINILNDSVTQSNYLNRLNKINTTKKSLSLHTKFQITNTQAHPKSPPPKLPLNQFHLKRDLKPVPHGYITKYQTQHIIIALRENQAKIYVEYNFHLNVSLRRLVSLLLIQKCWNKFIVIENIEKSQQLPNQVVICRKFDTFQILGKFVEMSQKFLYTAFNENTCMITAESFSSSQDSKPLSSKSLITIQHKNDYKKIFIEDQLYSTQYSVQNLKTILYEIHKQIVKIDLLHDQILIKNFEAQTIIENIVEEEDSTGADSEGKQSSEQIESQNIQTESDGIKQDVPDYYDHQTTQSTKLSLFQTKTAIPSEQSKFFCLRSPLQIPNFQYLKLIMKRQYQKNYFKHKFSQQILKEYDDYIPEYSLSKMVQNKQYEILKQTKQLQYIDQQLLDNQKDTLRFVVRQIGANIISGKSVLNVSLPVDIFQPKSGLERYAASFGYVPDLLQPIADSDPLQQIKQVCVFIMGDTTSQLAMKKPFNPILGQTFQGFVKGIPVYYEQISHHPPVSAYYMKCKQFQIYGNLIPFADVGLNTAVGGTLSPIHIKFRNGTNFECYFAPSQIAGLIYGDRKFRLYNKGFILERNLKLYGEFSVQNQKKGVYEVDRKLKVAEIIGGIFKVKREYFDQIDKFKKNYKNLKKFTGISKQFIIQRLNQISGEWLGNIIIDNQVANDKAKLYPVQYSKNVLPSDSNFRLDILYHKMNDMTNSQKQKQVLEILQRNDRKLREKYGEKRKSQKNIN